MNLFQVDPTTLTNILVFLLLYGAVVVSTAVILRQRVRRCDSTLSLPPLSPPSKPDPHEIAYIRGGRDEVVALTVFDLYQRQFLREVSSDEISVTLVQAPGPGYRGASSRLSQTDREVLDWFAEPRSVSYILYEELPPSLEKLCDEYENRMKNERLYMPTDAKNKAGWTIGGGFLAMSLLGMILLLTLPSVITVLLWILLSFFGLRGILRFSKHPVGRLSARGQRYLNEFRQTYQEALSRKITDADRSVALLVVAVFGFAVFAGTPLNVFAYLFPPRPEPGAIGGAGGGGGGCGAAGCGGGGCGGGGGGGCGGS